MVVGKSQRSDYSIAAIHSEYTQGMEPGHYDFLRDRLTCPTASNLQSTRYGIGSILSESLPVCETGFTHSWYFMFCAYPTNPGS